MESNLGSLSVVWRRNSFEVLSTGRELRWHPGSRDLCLAGSSSVSQPAHIKHTVSLIRCADDKMNNNTEIVHLSGGKHMWSSPVSGQTAQSDYSSFWTVSARLGKPRWLPLGHLKHPGTLNDNKASRILTSEDPKKTGVWRLRTQRHHTDLCRAAWIYTSTLTCAQEGRRASPTQNGREPMCESWNGKARLKSDPMKICWKR